MSQQVIHARGKLLLSAEYVVLDGALALALPTKFGQSLAWKSSQVSSIQWESFDVEGNSWFRAAFGRDGKKLLSTSDESLSNRLQEVLTKAIEIGTYPTDAGLEITTHLEFDRAWGLGTSSTLIYAIAELFNCDPYALLEASFGGSGYDLACAGMESALLYQLKEKSERLVRGITWKPAFHEQLWFVFLGEKQNSREGIEMYRALGEPAADLITHFSQLTMQMLEAEDLFEFEAILWEHEQLLSEMLFLDTVQDKRFSDYWGQVKSLGAWGGDFVLATSHKSAEETAAYFKQKGHDVILSFDAMIA